MPRYINDSNCDRIILNETIQKLRIIWKAIQFFILELSEWSKWTSCSRTCGTGERTRRRSCDGDSSSKDKNNPCKMILFERETCNTQKCPVYTEWTSWSSCSTTCGGGSQERTRVCILPVRAIFSGAISKDDYDLLDLQCDGEPKETR